MRNTSLQKRSSAQLIDLEIIELFSALDLEKTSIKDIQLLSLLNGPASENFKASCQYLLRKEILHSWKN